MDLFRKILARLHGEQSPSQFTSLLQVDEQTRDAVRAEQHREWCEDILRAGLVAVHPYQNVAPGTWGGVLMSLVQKGEMRRDGGLLDVIHHYRITEAGRARLAEMATS